MCWWSLQWCFKWTWSFSVLYCPALRTLFFRRAVVVVHCGDWCSQLGDPAKWALFFFCWQQKSGMRGTRGWYSIALVFTVEFYVLSFVVFEQSTNYCSWPSSQPCNHSLALLFLFFFLLFYQSLLYDHSAQSIGSVNGGSNEAVHSFLLPSQTLWIQATASSLVHWPLVFHWGCCAAFITDHIINYNTLPMQGQTGTILYKSNSIRH